MGMRVALVQSRSIPGDPVANLRVMDEAVSGTDADLFLFPELFLSGYDINGTHRRQAEHIRSSILKKVSDIAVRNACDLVVGSPILDGEELFNSLLLLRSDGEVERYDKIHLADFGPFHEKKEFSSGVEPFLAEIGGFKFGFSICYDLFFPEMFKWFALQGADALVCISASPCSSRKAFDAVLPARSVENTCYMLFVNNTGPQGSTEFFGGSRIISPVGRVMEESTEMESILVSTLDRKEIARARVGRPTLRDSRKDIWPLR